jgi:NADH-quinone oxidoreductase subunit G
MPKITIDGKSLEVPAGTSIIQAAQEANIPIAHYCWHEALSIAGACRMCMVEVEKNPKLQIACNTTVTEGMVVHTKTEKVKETVRWALDFHLINHPLDCPICDQAGECKLQDYYMTYGLYNPEMDKPKMKKEKAVSLGERVVLDQERCILCSRCVRFTSEISKTNELGIFNRGDRSVIGTFENRPMNNNYSVNTVDICPVGALTSKDFRFKQRVWFLKDFDTVCNGCSTGCNVVVSHNKNGAFRLRPRVNPEVNGHWMCDEGREVYIHTNKEFRLDQVVERNDELGGATVRGKPVALALQEVGKTLKEQAFKNADGIAVIVTGQYTVEEYETFFDMLKRLKVKNVYHWKNNEDKFDEFDGLLVRGDKNPNTKGLQNSLTKHGFKGSFTDYEKTSLQSPFKMTLVLGPENQSVYPDISQKVNVIKKGGQVIWLTACKNDLFNEFKWQIPMRTWLEKSGTFVNYKGIHQKIAGKLDIIPESITLEEFAKGIHEQKEVAV